MSLFVRYFTYLRDLSLAQEWQVESPVNILGFLLLSQQGPLNETREQTLATLSYLGSIDLALLYELPENACPRA
jgi:hypothetical protein